MNPSSPTQDLTQPCDEVYDEAGWVLRRLLPKVLERIARHVQPWAGPGLPVGPLRRLPPLRTLADIMDLAALLDGLYAHLVQWERRCQGDPGVPGYVQREVWTAAFVVSLTMGLGDDDSGSDHHEIASQVAALVAGWGLDDLSVSLVAGGLTVQEAVNADRLLGG